MKKIGKTLLNIIQIIVAFGIIQYLRSLGLNITEINDLGLVLALTATYSIIVGFLNRYSDDWAGFISVALMIYALIITLKVKYFMIGIPATILLLCVFYFPSGMNMERIRDNKMKKSEKDK